MQAENNHGAFYDAQRLAMALFIGDKSAANKIVSSAADRLDKQMDANGFFPRELVRTISLHYSTFVLEAFFNIAQMATHTNEDMWNRVTPSGKSLKKAFDALHPYLVKEKEWTYPQIKPYEYEEAYYLLETAAVQFKCLTCKDEVKELAGDKAGRLKIKLVYP